MDAEPSTACVADPARSRAEATRAARLAVRAAIEAMKPGQSVTYHRGFLLDDRDQDPVLAVTAAEYQNAAESWRGYLLQRRLGDNEYCYIFVRAGRSFAL